MLKWFNYELLSTFRRYCYFRDKKDTRFRLELSQKLQLHEILNIAKHFIGLNQHVFIIASTTVSCTFQ